MTPRYSARDPLAAALSEDAVNEDVLRILNDSDAYESTEAVRDAVVALVRDGDAAATARLLDMAAIRNTPPTTLDTAPPVSADRDPIRAVKGTQTHPGGVGRPIPADNPPSADLVPPASADRVLREAVVAAALEWNDAHAELTAPSASSITDADLLERYGEACAELLAVVSQNRDRLARDTRATGGES
jgi:hypothetical protein